MFLHAKSKEEWRDNWNASDKINYKSSLKLFPAELPFFFWLGYFK